MCPKNDREYNHTESFETRSNIPIRSDMLQMLTDIVISSIKAECTTRSQHHYNENSISPFSLMASLSPYLRVRRLGTLSSATSFSDLDSGDSKVMMMGILLTSNSDCQYTSTLIHPRMFARSLQRPFLHTCSLSSLQLRRSAALRS